MIGHGEFGRLRLQDFLTADVVAALSHWEFKDEYWVGEASGFTEFLRLESDPDVVRSIALDLAELPPQTSERILVAVGLPLSPGMSQEAVAAVMGAASGETRFRQASDRVTYFFSVQKPAYEVSCTIRDSGGLVYVVATSRAPRPKNRRRH